MPANTSHGLLSASHGSGRVTIGIDPLSEIRALSDSRSLRCPGCGELLILHAGSLRASHFSHLPGARCALPQSEQETLEHREGKLLIARWLMGIYPEARVTVEALIPETGQRADVLLEVGDGAESRRAAIEYQCANLTAREWRRRRSLYRSAGYVDLWLLGGSRCRTRSEEAREKSQARQESVTRSPALLQTTELERAMLADGAALLFLNAVGTELPQTSVVRFRPSEAPIASAISGRFSARPLSALPFPWTLTGRAIALDAAVSEAPPPCRKAPDAVLREETSDRLWIWLAQRYRVTPQSLPPLFGAELDRREAIACDPRLWQAAIYYRFIERRMGEQWWLDQVEAWARANLPLASPGAPTRLRAALSELQEYFAAAGFLAVPAGARRNGARIVADLRSLPSVPDAAETLKLARYRRIRDRG